MMKVIIMIIVLLFTVVLAEKGISPVKEKAILKKIIAQEMKKRNKYHFVTFTRKTYMKIYNYKEKKLLDVVESTVKITRNLKTKKKKIKVIFYKKNGKVMSNDKYKEGKESIFIDVFTPEGQKEYSLKLDGYKKIEKINTYVVRVIPKRKTKKHLSGTVYYNVKNLDPVAVEGRPAKYSFPLKKLYSYVKLKNMGGISVTKSSYIVMHIHVPFVFSHRKLVLSMNMYGHSLTP